MARTRVWRKGVLQAEDFSLEQVSDYLGRDDCVVWADLCAPGEEDLARVATELGLDPLAVEDAVDRYQRPKVDRYPTHLFLTTYAISFDSSAEPAHSKVSAFVLPGALVTVRQEDFDMGAVVARWDANPELLAHGVRALVHGLLDVVVDGQLAAVQRLDDRVEETEDALFDDPPGETDVHRSTYRLRKDLAGVRKVVLAMGEVVDVLRRQEPAPTGELAEAYRDLNDHVLRLVEWTEHLRDLVSTIYETGLSLQDARLNQIVKKLSAWAAIIAVPTAVTGFYGQNVPYPGYGQWSGFLVSTVVTVVLAGGIFLAFRRNGWL